MDKSVLIETLVYLQNLDEESAHVKADRLLLEYINDEDVTEAFEMINKWYA